MLTSIIIAFVCVIFLMLLEVPVAFAFAIGTVALLFVNGIDPTMAFSGAFLILQSYVFLCLPLYILLGVVIDSSGIADRLCEWFVTVVGRLRGGLGVAVVLTNGLFGAMSGASLSALAGLGKALLPTLEQRGYPKNYSIALLIPSATLSLLIPPSGGMIIFGFMGRLPITSCFLAPLIPGVIFMLFLCVVHLVMCRRIPSIKATEKVPFSSWARNARKQTWSASLGLLVPVVCLGGIYAGLYTPTEAAGVGALYALFLGLLVYRKINFKKLCANLLSTAEVTASIVVLIFVFSALSKVLIIARVSETLLQLFLAISDNLYVQLAMINLLMVIMGMIMDDSSAILVSAVVLLPVGTALGIDPYHFAAMTAVNLAMGIMTPPVAALLYLGGHIAKLPVNTYVGYVMIMIVFAMLPALLLTMYVPALSTYLPHLVMGR